MSYNPTNTLRLIAETERYPTLATFAEIERSNQLRAAHDEIARLNHELETARGTIEDVCIGTALPCVTCGKLKPCCCD